MRRRKSTRYSSSSLVCKMFLLVNVAAIACGLDAAPIPSSAKNDDPVLMSSDDPVLMSSDDPALMSSDDRVELKVSNGNSESKTTILVQNNKELSFKAIRPPGHYISAVATLKYGNCEVKLKWDEEEEKDQFTVKRPSEKEISGGYEAKEVDVTLLDSSLMFFSGDKKSLKPACSLDFSRASDGQDGYVMNVSLKLDVGSEIKLKFGSEYKPYVPRTTPKPIEKRESPSQGMPGYIIAIIVISVIIVAVSLLLGIAYAVYYFVFKKKGYNWDGTKTTIVYQTATPGTRKQTGTTQPTPTPIIAKTTQPTPIIAKKTSKDSKDKKMKKPSEPATSPKESEANDKTQNLKCIEMDSKRDQTRSKNQKCIELDNKRDQPISQAMQKPPSTANRFVNGSSVTRLSPTTLEMKSAEDRRIRDKKAAAAKEAGDKKRRDKRMADRIKKETVFKLDKTLEWQPKPAPPFLNTVCTQPESTNESSKKRKVETKQKLQKKQEDTSDTTENSSFWVKTIDSEAQD